MMSFLKFVGGVLLTSLLVIVSIARIAFEVIGASTAPDDFATLKQRMPTIANWLFTTPWPVPTAIMLLLAVAAGWLLWSATRKATEDEIEAHPHPTLAQVEALIAQKIAEIPPIEFPPPPEVPSAPPALKTLVRHKEVMAVTDHIIANEKRALAEKLIALFEEAKARQDKNPNTEIRFGGLGEPLRNYHAKMGLLGLDGTVMHKEHERIRAEVMGDAKYFMVEAGEPFSNGERKRQYHIARRFLDYLIAQAKQESYPYDPTRLLSKLNPGHSLT